MSWVSTNAEAYGGTAATSLDGSFSKAGMVINYGGSATGGTGLPTWVVAGAIGAAALVLVVWLAKRK